jgi:hypothetical protein
MMRKNVTRSLMLGLLFVPALGHPQASTPPYHVVKLRADEVTLTDAKSKQKKFSRADFISPWLLKGKNADGTLRVEVNGVPYSVASYDVVTDEPKDVTCMDKGGPKPGVTRGMKECK